MEENFLFNLYMGLAFENGLDSKKNRNRSSKFLSRPYVGAIVVSKERIYHGIKSFIGSTNLVYHAERMALDSAGEDAKGATLITTLEPCLTIKKYQILSCCSDLLIERGISRLVFAETDENPNFTKKRNPRTYLQDNGIEVIQYTGLNGLIEKHLSSS